MNAKRGFHFRIYKHVRKCQTAQSLVEFALTLPLLLLILLGAVDLGRIYHTYVTITNAAREGARYGTTHPTDTSGIQTSALQEAAGSGIALAPSNIVTACFRYDDNSSVGCSSAYNGDRLRVTITTDFEFLTLYLFRIPKVSVSNFAVMAVTNGLSP
jgi:hypothetical protein